MRSRRLYEIRRKVLEALESLAEDLNATVYLFGSYARGDHTMESDVDIIVVSEAFRGIPLQERVVMVRLRLPGHIGFDILPLTPEEFKEKQSTSFFREISKYWIELKGKLH